MLTLAPSAAATATRPRGAERPVCRRGQSFVLTCSDGPNPRNAAAYMAAARLADARSGPMRGLWAWPTEAPAAAAGPAWLAGPAKVGVFWTSLVASCPSPGLLAATKLAAGNGGVLADDRVERLSRPGLGALAATGPGCRCPESLKETEMLIHLSDVALGRTRRQASWHLSADSRCSRSATLTRPTPPLTSPSPTMSYSCNWPGQALPGRGWKWPLRPGLIGDYAYIAPYWWDVGRLDGVPTRYCSSVHFVYRAHGGRQSAAKGRSFPSGSPTSGPKVVTSPWQSAHPNRADLSGILSFRTRARPGRAG